MSIDFDARPMELLSWKCFSWERGRPNIYIDPRPSDSLPMFLLISSTSSLKSSLVTIYSYLSPDVYFDTLLSSFCQKLKFWNPFYAYHIYIRCVLNWAYKKKGVNCVGSNFTWNPTPLNSGHTSPICGLLCIYGWIWYGRSQGKLT